MEFSSVAKREQDDDALSNSSETTLPSSEADAMLALEEGCKQEGAERDDDAMSASSEATLPSSETEAQFPHVEVKMEQRVEVKEEEKAEIVKGTGRTKRWAYQQNDLASKVFEWQLNAASAQADSATTSNMEERLEEEDPSGQLSQGGSYPCQRCPRTFWSRPNLEAHARVHSGERPFSCEGCGRCFAQPCHLRNHEIAAHGRPAPPRAFTCATCGRAFGRRGALALHVRVHAQQTPPPQAQAQVRPASPPHAAAAEDVAGANAEGNGDCAAGDAPMPEVAGDRADEVPQLPMTSATRPAGPVTCDVCGKTLSHRCSLARHMRTHSGAPRPRPHRCGGCGAAFGTAPQLADHERRRHTGERPFACARCGRRFHSRAHLKYHERAHDAARPFRCDFCLKAFMSQFGLTRHRRVHTGDFRYKCEECPDAFVSRGQLLAHARNHAGERRPFACALCTASFVQRGLLTLHLRKHTGEQPFRCAACAQGFPHRRLLVAHHAVCARDQAQQQTQKAGAQTQGQQAQNAVTQVQKHLGVTQRGAGSNVAVSSGSASSHLERSLTPATAATSLNSNQVEFPREIMTTVTVSSSIVSPKVECISTNDVTRSPSNPIQTTIKTSLLPNSGIICAEDATPAFSVVTSIQARLPATTSPQPRLLLVPVNTPEKNSERCASQILSHGGALESENEPVSNSRLLADPTQGNHGMLTHLDSAKSEPEFETDSLHQMEIKSNEESISVNLIQTLNQGVTLTREQLAELGVTTPISGIVEVQAFNEDDADVQFNSEPLWVVADADSKEESFLTTVKEIEDLPPEVVIKLSQAAEESDNAVRSASEFRAAYKPKIVRVESAPKSLCNLPVNIEVPDKGYSWPTWPTAVVTIKIDGDDEF